MVNDALPTAPSDVSRHFDRRKPLKLNQKNDFLSRGDQRKDAQVRRNLSGLVCGRIGQMLIRYNVLQYSDRRMVKSGL
jgi:hypothetical protein